MGLRLNGRYLGVDPGNLNEAYSGASDDGLWEGVDLEDHQQSYAQNGATDTAPNLKMAWLIIIVSLGLLWLLGGIVFRVALR